MQHGPPGVKPEFLFDRPPLHTHPGVRSFLTFFSEADCEADCGTVGYQAFGRIQRLCQHLDRLISRTDQEKNRKKRRNLRKAQARMRQKIINLVDELHWRCARWLTSNYRVILLPKFETQSMTRRGERQIHSKTARMMLSFQHYRFKKRLQWKAWQRGSLVLEVNEAYTRNSDGNPNSPQVVVFLATIVDVTVGS